MLSYLFRDLKPLQMRSSSAEVNTFLLTHLITESIPVPFLHLLNLNIPCSGAPVDSTDGVDLTLVPDKN